MTNVWVLIPAHRPALSQLQECLMILGDLANHALVVSNGEHPLTRYETHTHVLHDPLDINISRWWNRGLRWIAEHDAEDHHVLILNADARIRPVDVARLSYELDQDRDAVMAGPKPDFGIERETRAMPLGTHVRIPGFCFMLRGRTLMADERFRWWCGDDDLEWRARLGGGTLRVGRIEIAHLGDGMPRGHLMELAKEDLVRFEEKWGIRPW